ncbi:MAG: ATP phosphoribosyltransferase regulatory subunit [Actinobacteria bacterium]|nr:ATP phosphoribosyltransferase regulatory subunit [Actinomycetota bacterium]
MFVPEDKSATMKLPFGFRDIFPSETFERNAIKETISCILRSWGYGEVKTPVLEYTSNISIGVGREWRNKLVNFFDIDGSLVSLRADMTIPIARLTGMRVKKSQLPVRFYYFSDSFRQTGLQKGIKRVYNQAGLEFIGSGSNTLADSEVLIILIRIMEALGLKDFRIGIGHVDLIGSLCRWMNLDPVQEEELKSGLVRKNFVGMENLLYKIDRKKTDTFLEIIQPEQDGDRMGARINRIGSPGAEKSYEYIIKVQNILDKFGYGRYLMFDFSIIRDFDYYTGLLFEVYNPKINGIVGSGGRYDGLIKKFGLDVPATGFALDIDLLHGAMGDIKIDSKPKILLAGFREEDFEKIISVADRLREKGASVELVLERIRNLKSMAVEKGMDLIIEKIPGSIKIKVTDVKKNSTKMVLLDSFIEGLA